MNVSARTLRNARRWCATRYRKRREDRRGEHPSHLACAVMLEAEKRYNLGTFGVEGWCDRGRWAYGWNYLNTGDPYAQTVMVRTTPSRARFYVKAWGDTDTRKHPR